MFRRNILSFFVLLWCMLMYVDGIPTQGNPDVGDGRYFVSNTVNLRGRVSNVEERTGCCQKCSMRYPGSQMYDFFKASNECLCYQPKLSKAPETEASSAYYAGLCSVWLGGVHEHK